MRFRHLPAVLIGLSGCYMFDVMGEEEAVIESGRALEPKDPIADDRIEDKHPVYDETLTIVETFGGCQVTLNKSGSITKLDTTSFEAGDEAVGTRLYKSYAQAAKELNRPLLPSMEVVQGMLKPFNDGLYAAVEVAAQEGTWGSAINKAQVFKDVLAALVGRMQSGGAAEQPLAKEAAVLFGAALQASGQGASVPASIASDASSYLAGFNGAPENARPIGFYTWTKQLEGIFQQDRLLQCRNGSCKFEPFAATASVLNANADLSSRFNSILDLYSGLTNPMSDYSPRELQPFVPSPAALADVAGILAQFQAGHPMGGACLPHLAMVPASDAPENRLFTALFCPDGVPADVNMIDVLIDGIRSGKVDLTPTENSGWYDRQLYALETLLVPERAAEKDHLFLTKRYKEKLIETFKTIITQNRETHVKQIDTGSSASSYTPDPNYDVYPLLPVEPFPTFYLRTARGYAFLDTMLRATMGTAFLDASHRMLDGGADNLPTLGRELYDKACLVYGLSIVSAASIGMRPLMTDEELAAYPQQECEGKARAWLESIKDDKDLATDQRVIVPVFNDYANGTMRYWAVIGVKVIRVQASFYPGYEPKVLGSSMNCAFRQFLDNKPYLLMGSMVEVTRSANAPPLTRDEFRAICDANPTAEAIVKALESR